MAFIPAVYWYAASTAIAAYGAVSAAQAQAQSYKSQQNAANYNATVNKQNADAAMAAASANELAQRRENDQRMGMERARVAKSGGGFVGTNVGVLAQSGANLELSALNTRYQGAMQGRGLLAEANLQQYQGIVAGNNASAARTAGYVGAASSALSGTYSYGKSAGWWGT